MKKESLEIAAGSKSKDKYNSKNPLARYMVRTFMGEIDKLVSKVRPNTIFEVGCGEGQIAIMLACKNYRVKAIDICEGSLEYAIHISNELHLDIDYSTGSVYDLDKTTDADLVLCCEVLEHLEYPEEALGNLKLLAAPYYIFSVPNEPLWRVLNFFRGKYIEDFGNTPGHINHWTSSQFIKLISKYFDVVEFKAPIPWTLVLCKLKVATEQK